MPAYKDKQRGTWYAAFYYKDWTGATKHTVKRGFATQREAKEYERLFLNQQSHGADILFENLVDNYLDDMKSRVKPTTMENKKEILLKKVVPYFGKMKIRDIDTICVRKWQSEIMEYRNDDGKPYSQTYLKTMHAQLSAALNYAVKHYGLDRNPCTIAGSIGKQRAEEMNFWTQEQFEEFASQIKKPAMKLAFDILFFTGIRSGELLALTASDILPDKKIDINKNYAIVDDTELFLTPKTDKSCRKISIPDFLYDEIMEYIGNLYEYSPDERIFYFTKRALEHEIHRGADAASLPHIRVHDLRHSHASLLINMGFDIKEISERLGHESVKTTWDIYSHLYPDSDVELANKLNQIRRPSQNRENNE